MFPGALCASGRPERSFQLNTRIEARDSCVPGTMARQPFRGEGEPPKEQPPAWAAYPGPWENILRTVTKFVERYPDVSSSGGCVRFPVRSMRTGLFVFPACVLCRRGGPAQNTEEEQYEKKDSLLPMLRRCWSGGFVRGAALRKAARRTNRVRAWWNARQAAARALAWNDWARTRMRACGGKKICGVLRRSAGQRRKAGFTIRLVPAAAAHCLHAALITKEVYSSRF